MSITSRYPIDASPPSALFDPADAEQAIGGVEETFLMAIRARGGR